MVGSLRCQVPFPKEAINELRAYLTEVVGLARLIYPFAKMAQVAAYQTIGELAYS